MSSSVSIDLAALEGTLCSVPSLSDGTVAAVATCLTDQEPELATRLNLARLLDTAGADYCDNPGGE